MATTYANDLRIAEMVPGEEESTWGELARKNHLKIISALLGYQELVMASSDITLTTENGEDGSGTTDQAASLILECTSAGSISANIDIIAPNISKMYIVANNTTQTVAETVSIKTSGGAALEIPNGETYIVWCDGSDGFFTISAQLSGTVALAVGQLQPFWLQARQPLQTRNRCHYRVALAMGAAGHRVRL